jgi:hypothetical protein
MRVGVFQTTGCLSVKRTASAKLPDVIPPIKIAREGALRALWWRGSSSAMARPGK